jgi:hypothetical protein
MYMGFSGFLQDFTDCVRLHRHSVIVGYRCGTCIFGGMSSMKADPRQDKFRKHFRGKQHRLYQLDYQSFQCLLKPCFYGANRGGLFFASGEDLQRHREEEHAHLSISQTPTGTDIGKFLVSDLGNGLKRSLDYGAGSEAKRGKRQDSKDLPFPSGTTELIQTDCETRATVSEPVLGPDLTTADVQGTIEESLPISLIQLQALTKQHQSKFFIRPSNL